MACRDQLSGGNDVPEDDSWSEGDGARFIYVYRNESIIFGSA